MSLGIEVSINSSQLFLQRLVKGCRKFVFQDDEAIARLKDLPKDKTERDEAVEKIRVVANVLGFCVMATVNYAQGQSS